MKKETDKIIKKLPKKLSVALFRAKEGGFCAEVKINNDILRTEAENLPELIEMVNDAVYTYFEIPEKFISEAPTYIPPVEVIQDLNLYPTKWSRILTAPPGCGIRTN
jgi:hypothetical protein